MNTRGLPSLLSIPTLLMMALNAGSLRASPTPLQAEFLVSEWTTGFQGFPRVAMHSSGSFVVVWDDYGRDGSHYGVFGRLFDSAGHPVSPSFQVNTTTIDYQRLPAVAMGAAGTFVVVWDHYTSSASGYDIRGQLFDSAGNKVGAEFQINSYTTGWQRIPDVAMDDAGDFVVIWEGRRNTPSIGGSYDVFGQLFDSTGVAIGGEFQVNTFTTEDQDYPRVAMNGSGDWVVVWESRLQDGSQDGIFGRRYDSSGAPVAGEFQVNTYTSFDQLYPVVTVGPKGDFVIAWDSAMQDGSGAGVFMRRYDSSGAPLSGDLQVNTHTPNYQTLPAISNDDAGNFVVVWNSFDQLSPTSYYDIFGQLFDTGGMRIGDEFQVNMETFDHQRFPAVAMSGTGEFAVVWDSWYQDGDASGIFGRVYRCDECDPDTDDDGTANEDDLCPETPPGTIVNPRTGCSIAQLCPCLGNRTTGVPWRNHGQYVRCVTSASMEFTNFGLITRAERARTIAAASRSSCGTRRGSTLPPQVLPGPDPVGPIEQVDPAESTAESSR